MHFDLPPLRVGCGQEGGLAAGGPRSGWVWGSARRGLRHAGVAVGSGGSAFSVLSKTLKLGTPSTTPPRVGPLEDAARRIIDPKFGASPSCAPAVPSLLPHQPATIPCLPAWPQGLAISAPSLETCVSSRTSPWGAWRTPRKRKTGDPAPPLLPCGGGNTRPLYVEPLGPHLSLEGPQGWSERVPEPSQPAALWGRRGARRPQRRNFAWCSRVPAAASSLSRSFACPPEAGDSAWQIA